MDLTPYVKEGYKKDPYLYAFSKGFKHFVITVFPFQTLIQVKKTQVTIDRVISPKSIETLADIIYTTLNEEENQN